MVDKAENIISQVTNGEIPVENLMDLQSRTILGVPIPGSIDNLLSQAGVIKAVDGTSLGANEITEFLILIDIVLKVHDRIKNSGTLENNPIDGLLSVTLTALEQLATVGKENAEKHEELLQNLQDAAFSDNAEKMTQALEGLDNYFRQGGMASMINTDKNNGTRDANKVNAIQKFMQTIDATLNDPRTFLGSVFEKVDAATGMDKLDTEFNSGNSTISNVTKQDVYNKKQENLGKANIRYTTDNHSVFTKLAVSVIKGTGQVLPVLQAITRFSFDIFNFAKGTFEALDALHQANMEAAAANGETFGQTSREGLKDFKATMNENIDNLANGKTMTSSMANVNVNPIFTTNSSNDMPSTMDLNPQPA